MAGGAVLALLLRSAVAPKEDNALIKSDILRTSGFVWNERPIPARSSIFLGSQAIRGRGERAAMLSSAMENKRRNDLAATRAEIYAPRPTGGAFMAGALGGGLLLAADAIVSGFYGWRLRDHLVLLALLVAGGFVLGLVLYIRLSLLNTRAHKAERALIDRHEEGAGPGA